MAQSRKQILYIGTLSILTAGLILAGLLLWSLLSGQWPALNTMWTRDITTSDARFQYYLGRSATGEWLTLCFYPNGRQNDKSNIAGTLTTRSNIMTIAGIIQSNRIIGQMIAKTANTPNAVLSFEGTIRKATIDCRWKKDSGEEAPSGTAILRPAGTVKTYKRNIHIGLGKYGTSRDAQISFPVLTLGTFTGAESLNKELERAVTAEIKTFHEDLRETVWEGIRSPSRSWHWTSDTHFEVMAVATNLFSARAANYNFTGGAHGNQFYTSFNYFSNAKQKAASFSLSTLLNEEGLRRCSDICLDQLRKQGASSVVSGLIGEFKQEDFEVFTLNPLGLVFTFPPYTVGSYVEGTYRVLIPAGQLTNFLSSTPAGKAVRQFWRMPSK